MGEGASGEIGVLVTGSGGRLGRMLRAAWDLAPPAGLRVTWQGRGSEASVVWDILHAPWPGAAPAPDVVLHLAGVVPGPGARLADNTALALAVCRMAATQGAARVLLSSSAAVYGPTACADEATPPAPTNAYGAAKLAMERAAFRWRRSAGAGAPGLTMLRIGNVAGADALLGPERASLELDDFPGQAGGPLRSYVGPLTLARVLAVLIRAAARGPMPGRRPTPGQGPMPEQSPALPDLLNLAAPRPVAMADLARAAGLGVALRPAPAAAVARLVLDTRRLEALVPFEAADSDPAAMVDQWRRIGGRTV